MKATLKNHRQSPRKIRLVADQIKGKGVQEAFLELRHIPKKATHILSKVLKSAVSNAKENDDKDPENLYIKDLRVDEGITLYRYLPRARGRATPIRRRTSHISIQLAERSERENQKSKSKDQKEAAGKT